MSTPYQDALNWIERHPYTGSANGLARLVLSLWNESCGYSFRECISSLDENLTDLALRMVAHFAKHGEDQELVRVGYIVCKKHFDMWEAGQAMQSARRKLSED